MTTDTVGRDIIDCLQACEQGLANQTCADQQPGEPRQEYAFRVFQYVLMFGAEPLSLSQLETADAEAQHAVSRLPAHLDADAARLDATLHTLRLRLAARMQEKRAQRARLQRLLDQTAQEPPPEPDGPHSAADTAESDADRAARLLRAALLLIMGPQQPPGGGGGRPAVLIRPTPKLPPSGQVVNPYPPARRDDDIDF